MPLQRIELSTPRQSAVAKGCGVTIRRRSVSYGGTCGAANTTLFLKKQGEFFPPLKISGLPVFRNRASSYWAHLS